MHTDIMEKENVCMQNGCEYHEPFNPFNTALGIHLTQTYSVMQTVT